jgi:hypothetical protein
MKSESEFDFLDMPNNFNLEVGNSYGFQKNHATEEFSRQVKIKNKIPSTENDKCPSSNLIIKILKNVKISQEKVLNDLNNTGLNFCNNHSILEKIKLAGPSTIKTTEVSEDVKLQNAENKKNFLPGVKRK